MMALFSYRDQISVDEFFNEFLFHNRPCLISNLTGDWKASEWRVDDRVNFELLSSYFGHFTVPIADCGVKEFNANPKSDWIFRDYLNYWKKNSLIRDDAYSGKLEHSEVKSEEMYENQSASVSSGSCLYLKDWHFTRDVTDYVAYATPPLFSSDWLNEFYSQRSDVRDDYRFVYMGPRGTWTPLHYDVFRSYSWSANIVGTKLWIIFPKGDERLLKNMRGELEYDAISRLGHSDAAQYIDNTLRGKLDPEKHFQEFSLSKEELYCHGEEPKDPDPLRVVVVVQRKGETIFVPSGWHHQVHNIDDVISINHNWVNACNVNEMWVNLSEELERVRVSISDCVEMEGWHTQCQLILSSLAGMDYSMLCRFILVIALPRMVSLADSLFGLRGCESIADKCRLMGEYIRDYLSKQKEYTLSIGYGKGNSFVPLSESLLSYLPNSLNFKGSAPIPLNVVYIIFEFFRLSQVLTELVLSKDIQYQFQDSNLFSVIKIFQKDLSSLW